MAVVIKLFQCTTQVSCIHGVCYRIINADACDMHTWILLSSYLMHASCIHGGRSICIRHKKMSFAHTIVGLNLKKSMLFSTVVVYKQLFENARYIYRVIQKKGSTFITI